MRAEPWTALLRRAPHLLALAVPMALLRSGRVACVVAQRLRPAVWVVRAVRRRQDSRRLQHGG